MSLAAGFHLPSALCVPWAGGSGGAVAQSALVLSQKALSSPKGKACCLHGALTGPRGPGPGTDFRLQPLQLVTSCIPRAQPWEVSRGRGPPGEGARPARGCKVAAGAAGTGDLHPCGEGAELSGQHEGRAVWPRREPGTGARGAGPPWCTLPAHGRTPAPGSPGCKLLHPALGGAQGGERTLPAEAGTRLRSPLPAQACSHCLQ